MSIGEIKTNAKDKFKEHWSVLLLVLALTLVAEGLATVIGFGLGGIIVNGPLLVGIYYVYSNIIKEKDSDWQDMLYGFKTMFADSFAVIALVLLVLGVVTICVGIAGGILASLSTMIPGIGVFIMVLVYAAIFFASLIVAFYILCGYAEAPILLLKEPGIKPLDALKKSRLMMQGNKKTLFIFDLSFIGWFVLAVITLGLLMIYVGPYYWYARTMLLEQIYTENRGVSMDDDEEMQKLIGLRDNVKSKTDSVTDKVKEKKEEFD